MSDTDRTSTISAVHLARLYGLIDELEDLANDLTGDAAAELDDLTARIARYAANLTHVRDIKARTWPE